jgi:hypothetical protein
MAFEAIDERITFLRPYQPYLSRVLVLNSLTVSILYNLHYGKQLTRQLLIENIPDNLPKSNRKQ